MGYKVVIVGCGAQGKVIATWASRDPEIDEVILSFELGDFVVGEG